MSDASGGDIVLTHIGGPTLLIEVGGWRLLTDPTFDPAGCDYSFGVGIGSTKLTEPSVAASEIGPIDAVLLSHDQHEDNLDVAGRQLLPSAGAVITTSAGGKRLGANARGLAPWERTRLEEPGKPSIEITATPCRHGPPLSKPIVGEVTGFALDIEGRDGGALWISGDTVLYPGVLEVASRIPVDTAILHLGGVRFPLSGPLRYTLTAKEAIKLCGRLNPRQAIPIHYEGWKHFREGREAIERELAAAPDDVAAKFRWLPIGAPETL